MRVGYLTYGLDRSPTGIGRYVVALLDALTKLDGTPEMVLLTTERSDPLGLWDRFEHHSLPGCRLLPSLLTLGNVFLSAAARRYRLDLIHDPNGVAPFLGPRFGARRLVTLHDAVPVVIPEAHNRIDTWRFRFHLPLAVRGADLVLTDSANSRDDLLRNLPVREANTHVVYCGVEGRFTQVPDRVERRAILARYGIVPPYVLYVGGLNARKNIARLLEAFARIREQHPTLTLVIGGKRQWLNSEMDATFEQLALGDRVRFTGYLDDSDLPALYSAAEAFVFPSLYEGFGLPPLEAMACGTPTLTSNASSLPEVVGEAALTVDPYSVEALSAALDRILTDEHLRATLRERGPARARQFTWERAAQATLAIYGELFRGPGSR